ncbi:MAG: bifunctional pyr operon transcriptional regulator/uracil phosphoribosyltransferase PyrR [Longimicrobiales bacterium]|nr:bifunctional pyr operon transcriptional regulator/uracil phosphoribosyltransferase PyrR [Longimicrobiales bacterium]
MPPTADEVLDEGAVRRALARMGREIVERTGGSEGLVLMGIRRRGDALASLLKEEIDHAEGSDVPIGVLDITLYRDDLGTVGPIPEVGETEIPRSGIEGRDVVIVDDVLFTGRTVRAALDELIDWGRPARILLCVLVERDGRELPIRADVAGVSLQGGASEHIEVRVPTLDGRLAVDRITLDEGEA